MSAEWSIHCCAPYTTHVLAVLIMPVEDRLAARLRRVERRVKNSKKPYGEVALGLVPTLYKRPPCYIIVVEWKYGLGVSWGKVLF